MQKVKTALLGAAAGVFPSSFLPSAIAAGSVAVNLTPGTVPGWPAFVAMGAVGGPDINPPTLTSTGGDDDFGGRPVDVVFKYAGSAGTGDPGIIDPPTNDLRMTNDMTT